MKPFRISNYTSQNRLRWFNWLAVGVGVVYLYLAFDTYFVENDQSEAIINLILGLFWLVFGYVNQNWYQPSIPDIILDETGITVEEEDTRKLLNWEDIQNINIDNNTLSVFMIYGKREELNIWTIEYKELQILKDKLQYFTNDHNIRYSSKY